jgi:N-acetyl-anhydromuramyl-L-alanine amidase AmpD
MPISCFKSLGGIIRSGRLPILALVLSLSLMVVLPPASRAAEDDYDSQAKLRDIFDAQRLRLTADYDRIHYGMDSCELREPRMIVLHYTAIPSLDASYRFFLPALLDTVSRKDISSGGAVNVSAHYLVDRDGTVVQLASEKVVCRHVIGFNYTAIGIENVGSSSADLTQAQVVSNAALVSRIKKRHPSIEYLIGHQEYQDAWRPHFKLYRGQVSSYHFTEKHDPGVEFLKQVRAILKESYGMVFKD